MLKTVVSQSSGNTVITGGSIDGTPIGAATPSTGAFTTLSAQTITFNSQVNNATTTGAITINWTTSNYQLQAAPTGTITYTFTAPTGVSHLQLFIAAPATAQTINWPGNLYWLGATWSGTNNKASVISMFYDGTNYYAIGSTQV